MWVTLSRRWAYIAITEITVIREHCPRLVVVGGIGLDRRPRGLSLIVPHCEYFVFPLCAPGGITPRPGSLGNYCSIIVVVTISENPAAPFKPSVLASHRFRSEAVEMTLWNHRS